jgi:hypothetical protein
MDEKELRAKLLEVARHYADERAWSWVEPVELVMATSGPEGRIWSLRTNVQARGRNIRMRIRESDLAVIDAAFLPR